MDWINQNLPVDAKIFALWDYGHMIRGIGQRDVIAFSPSQMALDVQGRDGYKPTWDESRLGDLAENQVIIDIALGFTSESYEELISIMNRYGCKYIFVHKSDYLKSQTLYQISGIESYQVDNFVSKIGVPDSEEQGVEYTINPDSIFYRMLKLEKVDGFDRVYNSTEVVIYKLV